LTIEDADASSVGDVLRLAILGASRLSLAGEIKVMWITTTIFGCEQNDLKGGASRAEDRGARTEISSAGRCLANLMVVVLGECPFGLAYDSLS
jgi:hypothetical protein